MGAQGVVEVERLALLIWKLREKPGEILIPSLWVVVGLVERLMAELEGLGLLGTALNVVKAAEEVEDKIVARVGPAGQAD